MLLMRKLALNALLAAAFECICLTAVDAQQPTTGEWVGRINLTSHPSLVRILIKADQAHGAVASMWMFPPPPTFPGGVGRRGTASLAPRQIQEQRRSQKFLTGRGAGQMVPNDGELDSLKIFNFCHALELWHKE